jgi:hypothetical protein
VHTLVAAVLLRVTGLDALDLDAEPEPPHGELGEVEQGIGTGEGNAVIGADGLGHPELLENGFEHGESVGLFGGGERLAGEDVAAGEVRDRERVAVAAIGEHELALVVGARQIIGLCGGREWGSICSVAPRSSALDQVVAVEDCMHRADRRRVHIRIEAGQPLSDFRRAPIRFLLLEAYDLRLYLERELVGVAVWPAGAVGEPLQANLVVASEDLVAGLAGDTEVTAQRGIFSPSSSRAMNLTRSSIWLHSFQGTFALPQKAQLCNPYLRNELSPFSQEGHQRCMVGNGSSVTDPHAS